MEEAECFQLAEWALVGGGQGSAGSSAGEEGEGRLGCWRVSARGGFLAALEGRVRLRVTDEWRVRRPRGRPPQRPGRASRAGPGCGVDGPVSVGSPECTGKEETEE